MSANYDRIATVTVKIDSPIVEDTSFSHILIIGPRPEIPVSGKYNDYDTYAISSLTECKSYGWKSGEPIYEALSVAFSQTNKPATVFVAGVETTINKDKIAALCDNEKWYALCPAGIDKAYYKDIATAISTYDKIFCYTETLYDPSSSTSTPTITESMSGINLEKVCCIYEKIEDTTQYFNQSADGVYYINENNKVYTVGKDKKYSDSKCETESESGTYYKAVLNDTDSIGVEITTPLYSIATYNTLESSGKIVSGIDYTDDNNYINVAFMLAGLYYESGSETFAFKKLVAVTPCTFNTAEMNALDSKHISYFITVGSKNITMGGATLGEEWIDIIRFKDWLRNEVQVRVVNLFSLNPKIRFNDGGITLIKNQIEYVLKKGQEAGGIAYDEYDDDGTLANAGYTIIAPKASEIPATQKQLRNLSLFTFNARLTGAIHYTSIQGRLSYDID